MAVSTRLDELARSGAAAASLAAAAVVAASTATGGLLVLPWLPPLDLAVGLALALGLLVGAPAVPGVAAGVLCSALLGAAVSWGVVLDAVAAAVLAGVGSQLWGRLPAVATGEEPALRSIGQWLEVAAVGTLASVTAVAVLAWTSLVVSGGSFHDVVLAELPTVLVSTALVAPAVLVPAGALLEGRLVHSADRSALARRSWAFRGAVVAPVLWVGLGTVASLAVDLVQRIGGATFRQQGYGTLFVPFDPALVGVAGRRPQVLFGAMALALVVAAHAPWQRSQPDDQDPNVPTATES